MLLDSVVDDSSSKSNYNNDLVSLALTESGIQEGGQIMFKMKMSIMDSLQMKY